MNLNLARKWRSRTFDDVVGQDLSIRMLKNSLFLQHYFPVYLFSGQRGCGKTTLARIFASAVNCKNLSAFQADPKNNSVPCLQCNSCLAMLQGKHPDFIEIDAASHTGVDNVRQIIDAASLLPVLGAKKVYLIDEAHMLSKAAFNAFLKILEEPPTSVFFMLATTDPQKIIETVVSRCFQLFFKSIPGDLLQKHLAFVCDQEKISYDREGLQVIVLASEGSVRDALNLLEQVRFSHEIVNKKAVLAVLGHLDDERLLHLFDAIIHASPSGLLSTMHDLSLESYAAPMLWESCSMLLRSSLWLRYKVELETTVQKEVLQKIIGDQSAESLGAYLQVFYDYEPLFLKTRNQHRVLEMVLLTISTMRTQKQQRSSNAEETQPIPQQQDASALNMPNVSSSEATDRWNRFKERIFALDDPLLSSIFKQGQASAFDKDRKIIMLSFPQNFAFLKELLEKTQSTWQQEFQALYGNDAHLIAHFDGQPTSSKTTAVSQEQPAKKLVPVASKRVIGQRVDVSDTTTWQKTHILLQTFPGTITEVKEDDYA